jgi:hypothetical protein
MSTAGATRSSPLGPALGWSLAVVAVMLFAGCDRSNGVRELTAIPAPLPAGTYTRAGFVPRITLDLDGTWTSVILFDDTFDVEQGGPSPDGIAVQIARPSGLIGGAAMPVRPSDPAAAVAALRTNPKLTILEESEARIGGLTGRQVSIGNASDPFVGVLVVDTGVVWLETDRRMWIAFVQTPHGLVSILVNTSVANWDHGLTVAEPVLKSISIGG